MQIFKPCELCKQFIIYIYFNTKKRVAYYGIEENYLHMAFVYFSQ